MRKALLIVGLPLCVAAAASAGYLVAKHQQEGPSSGLYRDEDIAPLRKKLMALYLPISHDNAFLLLGIDRNRLANSEADFEIRTKAGAFGRNQAYVWCYRLSPGFCLAMYSEIGPEFGPQPTGGRSITHIAIGKAIPNPGNPGWTFMAGNPNYEVVLDETDKQKTEISLPRPGKRSRWEDWKYPNLTKTLLSSNDIYNLTGGFIGSTTDDFDEVLRFYSQKCYVPNGAWQPAQGVWDLVKSPYTAPDGNELEYLMFRGFDNKPASPAVRVHCLNLKTPSYMVSIGERLNGRDWTRMVPPL